MTSVLRSSPNILLLVSRIPFTTFKFLCVGLVRWAKKLSSLIRYSAKPCKGFQMRNRFERRVAVPTCKIDLSDSKPRIAYNKGQPRDKADSKSNSMCRKYLGLLVLLSGIYFLRTSR
jgi:hypothetical protein